MALETINSQKNITENSSEEKNITPHTTTQPGFPKQENFSSMITISKLEAENFLLAMEECVGDIEEQKQLVEKLIEAKQEELEHFQSDTIKKFNTLIETISELSEKIKATESYEKYLEERYKNANLSQDVALLEQQLQKEKAEISLFIRDITSTVTMKLNEIESVVGALKSADNIIEEKLTQFKDELEKSSLAYEKKANDTLDETSNHIQTVAESQFAGLKVDCNKLLESYTQKCREHLDTVKNKSLDFLKECENQNKKLIEKVPEVANTKISKKDIAIYAMSAVSIASLLVQMLV